MNTVLFPLGGVRLTTILALSLFLTIAVARGDRRPVYACVAWLFGFEALFEATSLVTGNGDTLGPLHALTYVALAAVIVPWTYRHDARPSWPLLAGALAVFMVWVATGFHVNQHTGVDFNAPAEVLNELSKILWAAAYLVPLLSATWLRELRSFRRSGEQPAAQSGQPAAPR